MQRSSWELDVALSAQAGIDKDSTPHQELAGEMFVDAHQRGANTVSYAQALDLKNPASSFTMASWDDGEPMDIDYVENVISVDSTDELELIPTKEGYDNTPIQLFANTILRNVNGEMMIAHGSYKFTFSSAADGAIKRTDERIDPITGNVTLFRIPYAPTRVSVFRGSEISTLK